MRHIRLDRDEFVAKVQANRDNHRAVFDKAVEGYRGRWIEQLERRLHDVRRGRAIDQYFRLPEPEDHTDDYDRVLMMARMQLDDVIELTEDEFAMYVMDQWSWKNSFTSTTSRYVGRAR